MFLRESVSSLYAWGFPIFSSKYSCLCYLHSHRNSCFSLTFNSWRYGVGLFTSGMWYSRHRYVRHELCAISLSLADFCTGESCKKSVCSLIEDSATCFYVLYTCFVCYLIYTGNWNPRWICPQLMLFNTPYLFISFKYGGHLFTHSVENRQSPIHRAQLHDDSKLEKKLSAKKNWLGWFQVWICLCGQLLGK